MRLGRLADRLARGDGGGAGVPGEDAADHLVIDEQFQRWLHLGERLEPGPERLVGLAQGEGLHALAPDPGQDVPGQAGHGVGFHHIEGDQGVGAEKVPEIPPVSQPHTDERSFSKMPEWERLQHIQTQMLYEAGCQGSFQIEKLIRPLMDDIMTRGQEYLEALAQPV